MRISKDVCTEIEKRLGHVPVIWDGKKAILEMKGNENRQWKQMEWIGFYFQYLCEQYLKDIFKFQQPKYGNSAFDGFFKIPFDFKSHATNTSSHTIPVNDKEAIECAINDYGAVGLLVAIGDVVYNDENRMFQKWHDELKGSQTRYVRENKKRGAWSRLRKCSLTLKQIVIIEITHDTLARCGSFQRGFRNSDGSPRREKVSIDLEKLGAGLRHCIDF